MPDLLTPDEVAAQLKIRRKEVYRLAREKRLPSILISPRIRRFLPEHVASFLQENTVEIKRKPGPRKRPEPQAKEMTERKTLKDCAAEVRALCR